MVDGNSDGTDKSMSSFVSDCARGLVGGWYTKLDSDVDSKDESDLKPSMVLFSISWAFPPNENGVKPLGGDVGNQVCSAGTRSSPLSLPESLSCPLSDAEPSLVKSPLCKADLGRSILSPSRNLSSTGSDDLFFSGVIGAGGRRLGDSGDTWVWSSWPLDLLCWRIVSSWEPWLVKRMEKNKRNIQRGSSLGLHVY